MRDTVVWRHRSSIFIVHCWKSCSKVLFILVFYEIDIHLYLLKYPHLQKELGHSPWYVGDRMINIANLCVYLLASFHSLSTPPPATNKQNKTEYDSVQDARTTNNYLFTLRTSKKTWRTLMNPEEPREYWATISNPKDPKEPKAALKNTNEPWWFWRALRNPKEPWGTLKTLRNPKEP